MKGVAEPPAEPKPEEPAAKPGDYVQKGENELTVDVISSLRNTFGPLHNKLATPYFPLHYLVGPFSFTDERNWTNTYIHVPYGLINGAEIVIRK